LNPLSCSPRPKPTPAQIAFSIILPVIYVHLRSRHKTIDSHDLMHGQIHIPSTKAYIVTLSWSCYLRSSHVAPQGVLLPRPLTVSCFDRNQEIETSVIPSRAFPMCCLQKGWMWDCALFRINVWHHFAYHTLVAKVDSLVFVGH